MQPPVEEELTAEQILARKKQYEETSESVAERVVLGPEDNEFNIVGWERSKEGGLKCTNYAEMERQKGVVGHLIKSFGANLVSGRSVVNISLPVRVFEPRSFLERIPDAWCYAPIFLTKAAFAPTPLERLQWVMTFMVAGLHRAVTNLKPFNPILGETFQACYKDGSQMFLEQISHHPPMSAFQLIGPNHIFHMHGFHEFAASMSPNSVLGQQLGQNVVEFFDGGRITYTNPYALVKGIVWGERNFTWVGTAHFVDEKNHLSCNLHFNPDEKNGFSKMFSAQKTPDDHIRGEILSVPPEAPKQPSGSTPRKKQHKQIVSICEGSWLDGISFGEKSDKMVQYWKKSTYKPFRCIPIEHPLPSDCRYREDLIYLLAGDEDESQKWKGVLEERQRADKNLRKANEKTRRKTVAGPAGAAGPASLPSSGSQAKLPRSNSVQSDIDQ